MVYFACFFNLSIIYLCYLIIFIATIEDGVSIVYDEYILQSIDEEYFFRFNAYLSSIIAVTSLIGASMVTILIKIIDIHMIGNILSFFILIAAIYGLIKSYSDYKKDTVRSETM